MRLDAPEPAAGEHRGQLIEVEVEQEEGEREAVHERTLSPMDDSTLVDAGMRCRRHAQTASPAGAALGATAKGLQRAMRVAGMPIPTLAWQRVDVGNGP